MPDATVNIGGNASGGLAAVAAMQGAIDGMHGRTLRVDVQVRGGAAVAGMANDLGRAGGAADRAGRSARGMGDSFDRAGRSARGMGDHMGRAGDHMGRMADEAERFRTHMAAVDNIMSGGAPGMVSHAQGMRQIASDAQIAARSVGSLGAGAQSAQRAISAGDGGGFRAMGANARGVTAEVMGIYRNTRQAITAAGEAGQAFSTASGHASQMGTDLARTGRNAGEAGSELARVGGQAGELARQNRSLAGSFANNPMLKSMMGWMGSLDALGAKAGQAAQGFQDVGSTIGGMAGMAGAAAGPLKMLGLASGISAIGMGALGAAVAGVGIAGVAEDFAHNNQLMNAGQQAVRGFNKEFSAMKSETSATGVPAMAALGASVKGVGHELAQIGAANMAPTLGMASQLAGSLTQTMKQLAPAIGPSERALTALGGAALGALGNSAPEIARFANVVTQNAGGLQSATEGIVRGASALGGGLVQAVSAAAPAINAAATGTAFMTDAVSGAFGIPSNFAGRPGPDGSPEGSVDTGIPDGQGGTVKTPGSSGADRFFSGASRGGIAGAGIGAAIGSVVPGVGTGVGMAVGGAIGFVGGGVAGLNNDVANLPGSQAAPTPTIGAPQSQKSMGLSSGGARQPSSDASRFSGMTGSQILDQQKADIGLPPVGQPMYSGVGPRGPGQSVGPMPAQTAAAMGGGSIAPLNNMMQAAQAQVAGGGAQTGQAMIQHVQKAVQTAAPAAAAGGASLGAGMNSGMAQGSTSTQTVTDTVIVKHVKHLVELAAGALGIHSPSTEFDYLGRMTMKGFGQGWDRASAGTFGAMGNVLTGAQDMAQKNAPGYDGSPGVTVTVKKPQTAEEYQAAQQAAADRKASFGVQQGQYKPGSEGWWSAHDNRAGQLAAGREANQRAAIGGMSHDERRDQLMQGRADRHEIALSRLGVQGHVDPRRDPNSAMNNANPFAGTGRDPVAAASAKAAGRFQGMYNQVGQLPGMFNKAGQNSTLGLAGGLTAHVSKIQAAGASLAGAGHAGYKKKDKQSSPSAEWAAIGGNSVAGVPIGFAAGVPSAVAAIGDAAAQMSAGIAGPLNNQGLQLGYSYATNVTDGAVRVLKTANFQAASSAQIANQQAKAAVGRTGLFDPAGSSVYKTPTVSFAGAGIAAQVAAGVKAAMQSVAQSSTRQPIHIYLDKQLMQTMYADNQDDFIAQLLAASQGTNG